MKNNIKKDAIMTILNRIDSLSKELHVPIMMDYGNSSKMTLLMDLDCLNDRELLILSQFGDESFIHDVVGIQNHINRTTRQLEDFFVPRCVDAANNI